MIPKKKKSQEELAALREELGVPKAFPDSENQGQSNERNLGSDESRFQQASAPSQELVQNTPTPTIARDSSAPEGRSNKQSEEPVVQLGSPTDQQQVEKRPPAKNNSLRKRELPLAPPTHSTSKTTIPTNRRSPADIAEAKRREAIANLAQGPVDPGAHLRKITAHPALLVPAYLTAFGAAATAWQRAQYFTPLALIAIATLLATYIFFAKKRSRHHSAILTIIIIMTLAFGGLHYAPLFFYAS